MKQRFPQFLLIATFVPLCWLMMQIVHELGHITAALCTGGKVSKVVLHPLSISRTDTSGSLHPIFVVWAGPVFGAIGPLALLAVLRAMNLKWSYLAQFFAGVCLIANGAYLGAGSFQRVGDAGDLIRLGCPTWTLWLFGIVAVPLGFYLWNGLGPSFGLGKSGGAVDHRAAYVSFVMLILVMLLEFAFSSQM